MDATHTIIQNLLKEMETSLQQSLSSATVVADWSIWDENVRSLQSNLSSQLERCRGRFSGDLESVGAMASREDVIDSLHQLEHTIDDELIYNLGLSYIL